MKSKPGEHVHFLVSVHLRGVIFSFKNGACLTEGWTIIFSLTCLSTQYLHRISYLFMKFDSPSFRCWLYFLLIPVAARTLYTFLLLDYRFEAFPITYVWKPGRAYLLSSVAWSIHLLWSFHRCQVFQICNIFQSMCELYNRLIGVLSCFQKLCSFRDD